MTKKKTKDLTPVDNKKRNKTRELLIIDEAEEIVSGVLAEKKGGRQEKYFLYRMLGLPPRVSATLCNYNEDYGYKLDKKFREDQDLRAHLSKITGVIPEQFENTCKLRLVDVAEIEAGAMGEYKANPKLAIEKPQLLKQIKQSAGVLADDDKPASTFVDIKYIQNVMRLAGRDDVTIDFEDGRILVRGPAQELPEVGYEIIEDLPEG